MGLLDKFSFYEQLGEELKEFLKALKTPRFYLVLLAMTLGLAVAALAINAIIVPNLLIVAGLTGVSVNFIYLFGLPSIAGVYLLVNIPVFFIAWREYHLKFILLTVIGVLIHAFMLEATQGYTIQTPDTLMAAVLAGIMTGFGTGGYLRLGGAAGGMDIVAAVFKKRFSLPLGFTFFSVNVINLLAGYWLFGLTVALYSSIYMFVHAWCLNLMQSGFSQRKTVLVITNKPEEVAQQVMNRMHRGVTFIDAHGGYTHHESRIVFTVIGLSDLALMKELLFQTDSHALMIVLDAHEVIGQRFASWEDQGYLKDRRRQPRPPQQPAPPPAQ